MQAPRTLTQSSRFNKLAGGLLITAAALAFVFGFSQLQAVDFPAIDEPEISRPAIVAHGATTQGEGKFDNTNAIADYAATNPMIRYTAVYAGEGFIEQSGLDYVTPVTTSKMRFAEENSWDTDHLVYLVEDSSLDY